MIQCLSKMLLFLPILSYEKLHERKFKKTITSLRFQK